MVYPTDGKLYHVVLDRSVGLDSILHITTEKPGENHRHLFDELSVDSTAATDDAHQPV